MSDFKFFCPECGQHILGDTAYVGTQISCPTCQKAITIPAAAATTPAPAVEPKAPAPVSQTSPQPAVSTPAAAATRDCGGFSKLAAASLICSVFLPLGSIPGVICGHLAKARLRRNIFLEGEKVANAGLLISYSVLMATVALAGIFLLQHVHFSPVKVMRESPESMAAIQPRVVDEVIAGDNEDDHDVDGQMDYTSSSNKKTYHAAQRGGSFSYMMKVLPDVAMTLNCHYWGGEKKGHVFDVAVDNQVIATQDLTGVAPGHFFDVEYKIPRGLTHGKTQVKVEFQAHAGMTAGGVYGCQILTR
jgi:hypothetical protein